MTKTYYKVWPVLQEEIESITRCHGYYIVWQEVITKWEVTKLKEDISLFCKMNLQTFLEKKQLQVEWNWRGVFRTQWNIYDEDFSENSSITDD